MLENIPTQPKKENESMDKVEEKESIEPEKISKLIKLKLQDRFLVPDSDTPDRLYSVAVKYEDNRIEAIQVGTLNRFVFDGDLEVIVLSRKKENHE